MTITTELFRDYHFVLTNDEDKIVAVISAPKKEGISDITDKVMLAIQEDTLTHDVKVTTSLHIDLVASCKPITFDVEGLDNEDDEEFAGTYYLEQVEIY